MSAKIHVVSSDEPACETSPTSPTSPTSERCEGLEVRFGFTSLLRVCQDETVTLEAIARAAKVDADAATARDEWGATALHHI